MNRYAYVVQTHDPIDPPPGSRVRLADDGDPFRMIELPDEPGIVWPMLAADLVDEPAFKPSQAALARLSPVGWP